jgi:hypothetical protein
MIDPFFEKVISETDEEAIWARFPNPELDFRLARSEARNFHHDYPLSYLTGTMDTDIKLSSYFGFSVGDGYDAVTPDMIVDYGSTTFVIEFTTSYLSGEDQLSEKFRSKVSKYEVALQRRVVERQPPRRLVYLVIVLSTTGCYTNANLSQSIVSEMIWRYRIARSLDTFASTDEFGSWLKPDATYSHRGKAQAFLTSLADSYQGEYMTEKFHNFCSDRYIDTTRKESILRTAFSKSWNRTMDETVDAEKNPINQNWRQFSKVKK